MSKRKEINIIANKEMHDILNKADDCLTEYLSDIVFSLSKIKDYMQNADMTDSIPIISKAIGFYLSDNSSAKASRFEQYGLTAQDLPKLWKCLPNAVKEDINWSNDDKLLMYAPIYAKTVAKLPKLS